MTSFPTVKRIEERDLLLPFLGKRDYLQLSTLYGAILPFVNSSGLLSLRVSKPIFSNRVVLSSCELGGARSPSVAVDCSWDSGQASARFFLTQAPSKDTTAAVRIAYDENPIIQQSSIRDAELTTNILPTYTMPEQIVALTKHYLSKKNPLRPGEKFLATQLDLSIPIREGKQLKLSAAGNLGKAHYLMRVMLDETKIGMIYFARVSQFGSNNS